MTTVAAVSDGEHVWMAADSLVNVYDRPIIGGVRKIRRLPVSESSDALIGFCGDGGLADLLDARVTLPPAPADGDLQQWAASVSYAVTDAAVEAGLVEDGRIDGHLLLAYRGRLWTLLHAQAIPHPDGVAALGSGEGLAIGAIRAVEIACLRDRYSGMPMQIEMIC